MHRIVGVVTARAILRALHSNALAHAEQATGRHAGGGDGQADVNAGTDGAQQQENASEGGDTGPNEPRIAGPAAVLVAPCGAAFDLVLARIGHSCSSVLAQGVAVRMDLEVIC